MATPLIPWEPCNIPEELQGELNRRKINRSFRFVEGTKGGWGESDGEWTKYRGPMTPWVRLCSNGYGREFLDDGVTKNPNPKPGFVFFGGKDFYNGYGFAKNASGTQQGIIGYMPDEKNTPHTIDNDIKTADYPIHVPPPEIEKITVTIQKELYRRVSVEWVCFSKKQLEYMTPYFLVPGITCVLEWGWNHFDPSSLIRLDKVDELKRLNDNPYPLYTKHILKSKGNYDVLFGKITHFEWSAEGNKIKCRTEITSQDRIYAGLIVDSNSVDSVRDSKGDEVEVKPLDNLVQFVNKSLTQFKAVSSNKNPESVPALAEFIQYIRAKHPDNWKEYVYATFYGRDIETDKTEGANKKEDFDYKSKNGELWLSMGLIMEAINYHSNPLKSFNGNEMFRVDIDDCVIGAHPNLISTDGAILLIPSAEAPKYFAGVYGLNDQASGSTNEEDYNFYFARTTNPTVPWMHRSKAEKNGQLPDYRIQRVCVPFKNAIRRDNLDELINRIRYDNAGSKSTFEFPFLNDKTSLPNSKPYPARYSGFLKNLYFNVKCLQDILAAGDCKTYPQLVEKILGKINEASGNFWDFRIVSGTGREGQKVNEPATMKVVDYRFMATANRGTIYSFDYFDADSLLQGMGFKPTLSNAQAIRTIYAQTNHPDKKTTLTNGENELLDYKFRDRLFMDEDKKYTQPKKPSSEKFTETMRALQALTPPAGAYQITVKNANGAVIVRRLALPSPEILSLLLDDGDEERNPKYTGIMPGIQATFTIQGIGGLRTFMMFLVRNLPEPYSHKNIVFRIVDVQETVEMSKWTTTITAGVIPLRDHIKKRLGIQTKTN
jgi:hypothetical protein